MNSIKETITLGGGCFWCTEGVFKAVKGITSIEIGYSGGRRENPTYEQVCTGATGHAEVAKIEFNPIEISLYDVLLIFMVTHDPTTLNQQGADKGTHYRSVIFFENNTQEQITTALIKELQPYYDTPIVTEVSELINYYKGEEDHQDYYSKYPEQAYCNYVIRPKLNKLKKIFADKMK